MSAHPHAFNTVANTQSWPQTLLDVLQRQHAMVDRLVQLAQSQAAFIAESRTDRLLDLLAQRQTLIDEFSASQGHLNELTQGLDKRLETVTTVQRDRIRLLINEIGERLSQVMHRDAQDQASLRTNRDQIRHELAGMGAARQARGAYLNPRNKSMNRFADQRG